MTAKQPIHLFLWLIINMSFFACDTSDKESEQKKAAPVATHSLSYATEKRSESLGCRAGSPQCTYVSFEYPHFSAGDHFQKVNRLIHDRMCEDLGGNRTVDCKLDEQMVKFVNEYKKFKREFPDSKQYWYFEEKVQVKFLSPDYLSIAFEQNAYTGGAHELKSTTYLNLSLEKIKPLELSDLMVTGYEEALQSLIQKAFDEQVKNKNASDSGVSTAFDVPVALPKNFALTAKGLLFYYNPYETGPYSAGDLELTLSYDELKELIKQEYRTKL